jgi:hypothetical protein
MNPEDLVTAHILLEKPQHHMMNSANSSMKDTSLMEKTKAGIMIAIISIILMTRSIIA